MCPREIARVLAGDARAARLRRDVAVEAAWIGAAAARAKRFPRLGDLLSKPADKAKRMDWRQMLGVATVWAASAGEVRASE